MEGAWLFRELRPGEKDRQPTEGESFTTNAIGSVAEALVRESIQNSLDGGPKQRGSTVRVRFFLANGHHALPATQANKYFAGGWKHFTAEGNGLDTVPTDTENCSYLVVEDFGTTGLTGDVNQWQYIPGTKNRFYYFFRTDGRSDKGEEDRGRRGVGKCVFRLSSRINALVALTVREDDGKCLLMGQAVLKSHRVGLQYFTPDGDYGRASDDGLILPVDDQSSIEQFRNDFRIQRKNEPGLSVVVPWVDSEITREALLRAVIEGYFFPILTGDLVVTIATGDDEIEINKDSLDATGKTLGEDFTKKMLPLLQLAAWAKESGTGTLVKLNPANPQRPSWEPTLVPKELIADFRQKFRSGEKMAVEVPLTVRGRGVPERESFFRFYLINDASEGGVPVFIRDGIIIPDVSGRWVPGVRSIVVVEHSALATLLGDSENPAHTQWQKERDHFRYKYTYGKSYIDFVTQSVAMFVRLLNAGDQEPDRNLLREIFSVPKRPESNEPKEKSRPRKRNKGEVIKDIPKVEPNKRRFTLTKVSGGFTITRGAQDVTVPASLEIAMAYDRRRGSALRKYAPPDFRLDQKPIVVETKEVKVVRQELNRLEVNVMKPDFHVTVTGFDENRDLYVNVDAKEAGNDS